MMGTLLRAAPPFRKGEEARALFQHRHHGQMLIALARHDAHLGWGWVWVPRDDVEITADRLLDHGQHLEP